MKLHIPLILFCLAGAVSAEASTHAVLFEGAILTGAISPDLVVRNTQFYLAKLEEIEAASREPSLSDSARQGAVLTHLRDLQTRLDRQKASWLGQVKGTVFETPVAQVLRHLDTTSTDIQAAKTAALNADYKTLRRYTHAVKSEMRQIHHFAAERISHE